MSYSINEDLNVVSTSKFIGVTAETCVDKNRFFDDFIIDFDKKFLDIIVRDSSGVTAKKRYFFPELGKGFIKDAETLKKEEQKLLKIIGNIAKEFFGDDYKSPAADSLIDLTSKVVNEIKLKLSDWKSREMWIKVVLDKNNFSTLPSYSPICRKASESKDDVLKYGLKVIPLFDKTVQTAITPTPDATQQEAQAPAAKKDDLPF